MDTNGSNTDGNGDDTNAEDVNMENFKKAVKDVFPSVTDNMVKEYKKMAKKVKRQSSFIEFTPPGSKDDTE